MYPYIRAIYMMLKGRSMHALDVYGTHVSYHRAWPWDTDAFGELNNGRILTLFELARWQSGVRMGMMRKVIKGRIMFPIAGVSVRYRKRVPTWQHYRVQTRFLGFDERFVYADQSMWQGETCMNQMLLRFAVKNRKGSIKPVEFLESLGFGTDKQTLPDWARNWVDADATRPWPPASGPVYDN